MPTRGECPLKPSPRPAVWAARLIRREIWFRTQAEYTVSGGRPDALCDSSADMVCEERNSTAPSPSASVLERRIKQPCRCRPSLRFDILPSQGGCLRDAQHGVAHHADQRDVQVAPCFAPSRWLLQRVRPARCRGMSRGRADGGQSVCGQGYAACFWNAAGSCGSHRAGCV